MSTCSEHPEDLPEGAPAFVPSRTRFARPARTVPSPDGGKWGRLGRQVARNLGELHAILARHPESDTAYAMADALTSVRDTMTRFEAEVPVSRLNLPATAPLKGEDQYAMLVAYGGAILAAEQGKETELVRPDGQVAARIVPS